MKKRTLSIIAAAALTAAAVSGCGGSDSPSVSAADVAKGAAEALESAGSVSSLLKIDLSGNFEYDDESIGLSMLISCSIDSITEDSSAYVTQDMTMTYNGETSSQSSEFYVVPENGSYYTYIGIDDSWDKIANDGAVTDETADTIFREIADGNLEAELASEKETMENGREAYVLTIPVTGDYLEKIIDFSFDGSSSLFGSADYSDMTMDTTLYIYEDTLEPALIEISCDELGQALFAQMGGEVGIDSNIEVFSISCEYTGLNDIDEISVPDDVIASVSDSSSDISSNVSEDSSTDNSQGAADSSGSNSSPRLSEIESSINNAEEIAYNSASGELNIDHTLTIDGIEYTIPVSYTEFAENGWVIDESADGIVYANDYDLEYMYNGDDTVLVYIYNPSSSDAEYRQCNIIGIDIYEDLSENIQVELSSGITLSYTTLSETLEIFGKPSTYYVDENMICIVYTANDLSDTVTLYFNTDDLLLCEIDIQVYAGTGLIS